MASLQHFIVAAPTIEALNQLLDKEISKFKEYLLLELPESYPAPISLATTGQFITSGAALFLGVRKVLQIDPAKMQIQGGLGCLISAVRIEFVAQLRPGPRPKSEGEVFNFIVPTEDDARALMKDLTKGKRTHQIRTKSISRKSDGTYAVHVVLAKGSPKKKSSKEST